MIEVVLHISETEKQLHENILRGMSITDLWDAIALKDGKPSLDLRLQDILRAAVKEYAALVGCEVAVHTVLDKVSFGARPLLVDDPCCLCDCGEER